MNGLLEVTSAGFANAIQDAGRFGYRHMGITVSGWLDVVLARCANALVGNAPEAACIEVRAAGPGLTARQGRIRVAVTGGLELKVRRANGPEEDVPAWTSVTLEPGDELAVGTIYGGAAYVAVGGGLLTPLQLGSRSTYQRAKIGGVDGRLLAAGDLLPCAALDDEEQQECWAEPWRHEQGPLRVMLGPQEGHFKPGSVQQFLEAEYAVTPQMDRMGMRLEGPALEHIRPEAADIVSDGVTPGVIQVPGNGQPIILLADCQTVGGYPKIATVISADLPRLAQLKPGQKIRFQSVDAEDAKAALVERETRWTAWVNGIAPLVSSRSSSRSILDDDLDAFCAVS